MTHRLRASTFDSSKPRVPAVRYDTDLQRDKVISFWRDFFEHVLV